MLKILSAIVLGLIAFGLAALAVALTNVAFFYLYDAIGPGSFSVLLASLSTVGVLAPGLALLVGVPLLARRYLGDALRIAIATSCVLGGLALPGGVWLVSLTNSCTMEQAFPMDLGPCVD